jgi:hypothetical protein
MVMIGLPFLPIGKPGGNETNRACTVGMNYRNGFDSSNHPNAQHPPLAVIEANILSRKSVL